MISFIFLNQGIQQYGTALRIATACYHTYTNKYTKALVTYVYFITYNCEEEKVNIFLLKEGKEGTTKV